MQVRFLTKTWIFASFMFKLGFLFQFTEENMMIFVPLSGFDIAGALLLKYCILLYFSFLGKYYWLKNNLSLSLSSKNKHIYIASLHLLLLLSILLLISYIIYNKRYKKNMYPFLQLRLRLETGRITWFRFLPYKASDHPLVYSM